MSRLLTTVGRSASRIRLPLFWRALYWLLDRESVVRAVGLAARLTGRHGPFALDAVGSTFVWSGWPHQSPGWVNLNVSRFRQRAILESRGAPRARAPRVGTGGARCVVGVLGELRGVLTLPRRAFEDVPTDIELHVFDQEFHGEHARYLEPLVARYEPLPAPGGGSVDASDVDLLLVVSQRPETTALLDATRAGCVAQICATSDLLHHPAIDFAVYCQPQADYAVRGDRLFCATSESLLPSHPIYAAPILYDLRGIDPDAARPWAERDPLILVHGSLYKAAAPEFLGALVALLQEDDTVELVLMGKDDGASLARIRAAAGGGGVGARVHYEGEFSAVRNGAGDVDAEGWRRTCELLARARLVPDAWPIGAGGSRVEAYAAGAPSVHLGVRFDRDSWRRRQPSAVELPDLLVPEATAFDLAGYLELCRRCLHDGDYAAGVADRQLAIARRVSDPLAFWDQALALHERWQRGR